jgi:hypothetical protein
MCRLPAPGGIGLVVGLYPSLIALSVNDLLKDPAVIFAAVAGVWCLARLARTPQIPTAAALIIVASAVLIYARMSRFYLVAFLEVALAVSVLIAWCFKRRRAVASSIGGWTIGAFVLVFVAAEAVPSRLGWPTSPAMVLATVAHTMGSPAMRLYATGLVDRVQATKSGTQLRPRHAGDLTMAGVSSRSVREVLAEIEQWEGEDAAAAETMAEAPLPESTKLSHVAVGIRVAANTFRKLFGPFPWIAPPRWDARTILTGDYLLFPGIVVWYAVLPFALAGIGIIGWRTLHGETLHPVLVALVIFVSILFAQYLVLNLSWRQREFMFPFLAMAGAVAFTATRGSGWWRKGYTAYWALLVLVACVHLAWRAIALA